MRHTDSMIFIGITGGVGAGKSSVLSYIEKTCRCRVMLADEIARDLMEPGTDCYERLRELFCRDKVFLPDGSFDRPALAAVLFSDDKKREQLNAIVHPAVKEYVKEQRALEKARGTIDVLVLEAALLIEENYGEICDELWYIYASEDNRRKRLKENRGYSDERIDGIFKSQLPEETFRRFCAHEIDNNGSPEDAFRQIDAIMQGD